jgi:predicted acylesterase/phospholipase RssA
MRGEWKRSSEHRLRDWRIFRGLFQKHTWYSPSGQLAMLLEYLLTARFDNISDLLESIRTPYLFDTTPVRDRLRKALGRTELELPRTKLAINTVDMRTGSVIRIVNAKVKKRSHAASQHYVEVGSFSLDMILASASIPLLFNPIEVGGMSLWDGGLLVNTPLAPAVALGASQIVPVVVTLREPPQNYDIQRFGSAVERLADAFLENAYNIDRKLLLERNLLARMREDDELREVRLYRAIRPESGVLFNAGSYLYFERGALLAMYEAGKEAARQWLAQGPPVDARELEEN